MVASSSSFWGLVAYASFAYAGLCKPSGDVCSEIRSLLGDEAVPLCSSYLQATPATVTVTSTTTRTSFQTIAAPPETISTSVEETTTVSLTTTRTVYPPNPVVTDTTIISVSTVYLYRPKQNRRAIPETVLASLESKYSKAAVTAGCNCVYDPTTETVTQTTDVTTEVTSQATIGPLTTVVVTEIKYIPITKATEVVVTVGPFITHHVGFTSVTTMNPTYFSAASCNVKGGTDLEPYRLSFDIDKKPCIENCKSDPFCFMTGWYPGNCHYYMKAFAEGATANPRSNKVMNDKDCPS
ncbi:unnamed protein product [Fusarium graminearum]|uniref:Chromosome 1, complete genome n=1 Tax=Gibberella zeae (strain ATCC MYA-4620 / CBS 123657 / FGSC 9075 / NRRL 31084 / PH-1) TaxID=229533 RepID=A0A098D6T1_GIBZE|nr:unnamed protein product [Fusarium graminearum]